jgi:hypothetical protein
MNAKITYSIKYSGVTGVAQSVQCLTTDWTSGVGSAAKANNFSSSLYVVTSSGVHPASCPMGTRGKERPGCDADHPPHLVPRSGMSRSYTSSRLRRLHGVAGQVFTLINFSDL